VNAGPKNEPHRPRCKPAVEFIEVETVTSAPIGAETPRRFTESSYNSECDTIARKTLSALRGNTMDSGCEALVGTWRLVSCFMEDVETNEKQLA